MRFLARPGAALAVAGTFAVVVAALGDAAGPAKPQAVRERAASDARIRLVAVGDIAMVENTEASRSYFGSVAGELARGDVTLGNLEGTLTRSGAPKCDSRSVGCFTFRAPPSYAHLLRRAGFDVLNLANNHAFDFGAAGQAETLAALARSKLAHTGRPGEATRVVRGGVAVAFVGFAPYPWAQDLLDIPAAKRLVRRAARRADVVVVTMHAGAEGSDRTHVRPGSEYYLGENRGNPVAFAHAVVDAGADVVVGHGPHVLRGLEWYRGRLIAYSLGNFLGCGTLATSGVLGVTALLDVTLRRDGSLAAGRLVPARLSGCGVPRPDARRQASRLVDSLSRADFGTRAVRVSRSGTLHAPR